jgi:hypothetical protein
MTANFNPGLLPTFSFVSHVGKEVPAVNKPRRACSYFYSALAENTLFQRSYFFPPPAGKFGDELKRTN